jgi:hypothetical protein
MAKSISKIFALTNNSVGAFEGIEMKLDALYNSTLDEGEWPDSRSSRPIPIETVPAPIK